MDTDEGGRHGDTVSVKSKRLLRSVPSPAARKMERDRLMNVDEIVCENCKHFRAHGIAGREKDGECRRFPPAPAWPNVYTAEWCAEFSLTDDMTCPDCGGHRDRCGHWPSQATSNDPNTVYLWQSLTGFTRPKDCAEFIQTQNRTISELRDETMRQLGELQAFRLLDDAERINRDKK